MTEAEIAQALQTDLEPYRLKAIVKQKQSHLHVLLSRSGEVPVDYGLLTKQVCTRLRTLQPQGVDLITVYGRVTGQKDYEWEDTRQLTAEETLVFDSSKMEDYLKELEMAAPEDEPPTEVYQPKAASVPFSSTPIDPEEVTLVAPNMTLDQLQHESAEGESSAPRPGLGPLSAGQVKLLAAVGAAIVVLLIALLFLL